MEDYRTFSIAKYGLKIFLHPHNITELGPPFRYNANASKTWLIVKKSVEAQARDLFSNTQINITSEGIPYLGAALGTQEYVRVCQ